MNYANKKQTVKKVKIRTDVPCHKCGMVTGTTKFFIERFGKPVGHQNLCSDCE